MGVYTLYARKETIVEIILPDGSKKILEEGATVYDVAASIGTSLAKAALAARLTVSWWTLLLR